MDNTIYKHWLNRLVCIYCKRKLVDKIKIINVSGFEECFILIFGFKSEKISNFCKKGKEQGEN